MSQGSLTTEGWKEKKTYVCHMANQVKAGTPSHRFECCYGFLGFVGESIVKHGERWKVLGTCEASERKCPCWSGALVFWEIRCDFVPVPSHAVPCVACPLPLPHLTSGPGRINWNMCFSGIPFLINQSGPNLKIIWTTCELVNSPLFISSLCLFVITWNVELCALTVSSLRQGKGYISLYLHVLVQCMASSGPLILLIKWINKIAEKCLTFCKGMIFSRSRWAHLLVLCI